VVSSGGWIFVSPGAENGIDLSGRSWLVDASLDGRILLCSELLEEVASPVEKYLMEGELFDELLTVLGTSSEVILMLATSFALLGKTSTGTRSLHR